MRVYQKIREKKTVEWIKLFLTVSGRGRGHNQITILWRRTDTAQRIACQI